MVAKLLVFDGWIDGAPVVRYQAFVAHFGRVVGHLHGFGMTRCMGGHLLIGRVGRVTAGVTRRGTYHPRNFVKVRLYAPETPPGKDGFGHCGCGRDRRYRFGLGHGRGKHLYRQAQHRDDPNDL